MTSPSNMLGIDVSGLDTAGFLAAARHLYPVLAGAWLLALLKVRRAWWLLLGALAANAGAWLVTTYPLQQIYAFGGSNDRVNNLALCQVVAAGNSPLRTWVVGQLHFEPFWGVFVAALSGWSPERVLAIYPFLPLLVLTLVTVAFYFGLGSSGPRDCATLTPAPLPTPSPLPLSQRPYPSPTTLTPAPLPKGEGIASPRESVTDPDAHSNLGAWNEPAWSPWERALVSGFATLLCAAPFDYASTYDVPWSLMFLLKPNHALGLVLFPLFVRAFASARGWRGRIGAGLVLHLLGWAFVLHMLFVCVGLVVFAASSWAGYSGAAPSPYGWVNRARVSRWAARGELRRDLRDVAVVIGVNLLAVSPYLVLLAIGYPFLVSSPRLVLPPWSPHLLEATVRTGWIFVIGVWGAAVAFRRGDRLGRVFATQVAAAYLVWIAYYVLSSLQLAREPDEIHHWLRVLTAAAAGVGAWDLVGRAAQVWPRVPAAAPARAALVALLAMPFTLPYWWDPARLDRYFAASLRPIPENLSRVASFLRSETDPRAVLVGERVFLRRVVALSGRRALVGYRIGTPKDGPRRIAILEALVRGPDPRAAVRDARRYGVQYLVASSGFLSQFELTDGDLDERPQLRRVFAVGEGAERVAVYRVVEPGA